MDRVTQRALNALNREFYARQASAFAETRKQPWPGFSRLLELARERWAGLGRPPTVLDVGSGDGRFAAFLHDAVSGGFEYVGVDASRELTAHARARGLGAHVQFEVADFVEAPPSAAVPDGPFDLVVLLGVLHHVPGGAARRELLQALARRVAPGGLLAFTFWHLPDDPRFASRVIPWREYNNRARQAIDEAQLEPGDTLLRFGQEHAVRYCHFPDPTEGEHLIAAASLPLLARFRADGRAEQLNEYVVLSAV